MDKSLKDHCKECRLKYRGTSEKKNWKISEVFSEGFLGEIFEKTTLVISELLQGRIQRRTPDRIYEQTHG